uniref:Vesicle associated membrane protein 2 n=1 Tax=Monodelphis domestica TaxID=13616 RepID=A0A5F8GLI2_MONDO
MAPPQPLLPTPPSFPPNSPLLSSPLPRPAWSTGARMWVTCGRHLPVPRLSSTIRSQSEPEPSPLLSPPARAPARPRHVVDIMRVNVDKVLERDQKLSELDDRADALQAGASQFETSAAKLKRKYWWKNLKMMIILGVICAIILILIIVYFST